MLEGQIHILGGKYNMIMYAKKAMSRLDNIAAYPCEII